MGEIILIQSWIMSHEFMNKHLSFSKVCFKNILILLLSKDALNWSKIAVKTFII